MEDVNVTRIVQMVKDALSQDRNMEGIFYLKSSIMITASEKFRKDFEALSPDVYDNDKQILYGVVPVEYVEMGNNIVMNIMNDFVREEDVPIHGLSYPPSDWGDGDYAEDGEW